MSMIPKPQFISHEFGALTKIDFDGNSISVQTNRKGAKIFRWNLWWLAVDGPHGEDMSISDDFKSSPQHDSRFQIDYCEIAVIDRPNSSRVRINPTRADFTLARADAVTAFHRLDSLVAAGSNMPTELFPNFTIKVASFTRKQKRAIK